MIDEAGPEGNITYKGYCVDLAAELADIIGYDYILRPVIDGHYGSEDSNGTWNGMIGEVIREVITL